MTPATSHGLVTGFFRESPAHVTALFTGFLGDQTTKKSSLMKRLEIRETAWVSPYRLGVIPLRYGTAELLERLPPHSGAG